MSSRELTFSSRIDFEWINRQFENIAERAKKATTINQFADLVTPAVVAVLEHYEYLGEDENYVEGEIAGLMVYLLTYVNGLVPKTLDYHATFGPNPGVIFARGRISFASA